MITLTTEQAQQIEEALEFAIRFFDVDHNTRWIDGEQCLASIRAARAQEQAEQEQVKRKWVEPSDELLNDILMRYAKTELYRDDFGAFRAVLKLAKELNT